MRMLHIDPIVLCSLLNVNFIIFYQYFDNNEGRIKSYRPFAKLSMKGFSFNRISRIYLVASI